MMHPLPLHHLHREEPSNDTNTNQILSAAPPPHILHTIGHTDDSIKVQAAITPRSQQYDSLLTPRAALYESTLPESVTIMSSDITPRSHEEQDGTALVHSSLNTFEDTVDISTLKLTATNDPTSTSAKDHAETSTSRSRDTLEDTEELAIFKNQLSRRLKQLQRQRNLNQNTPSSMTSRQEMAALEATGMTVMELNHEYGVTPSDLQGYLQMIQQRHGDSSNTNQYRSNGELLSPTTATHITTSRSETFYYKGDKVEHHILMPALVDSPVPKSNVNAMEEKMNIIAKVKSPSIVEDRDNDGDVDEDEDEDDDLAVEDDDDMNSENVHPVGSEEELEIQYGDEVMTAESRAMDESLKPPSIQVTPHLVSEPNTVATIATMTKRKEIVISEENQEYDNDHIKRFLEHSGVFSSNTPLDYRTSDDDVLLAEDSNLLE